MNTNITNNIIASTNGMELFAPVLTGEQHPVEWAQALAKESVTTKGGREISAARYALNGAQFGMTNLALAMRSATELGVLPYTQAVRETKRIYNLLDGLRSGFAGVRSEAHRELTVAEVTLEVKDGCFDSLQSQNDSYTREELEELAREGSLDWEAIDEILEYQDAAHATRQAELGKDVDSWTEDEGEYRTSIHDANQLWDLELKDIRYSEMAAARVALIGVEWPTNNPMWEPLLDRLDAAWEQSIEYADDKEAVLAKIAKREQALNDLWAKPVYARWAINHVTRRVFRDIEALKLRREDAEERLVRIERQAFNEERYGIPAYASRQNMGEQVQAEREYNLMYTTISESELDDGFNAMQYVDANGIHTRAATYAYATESGKPKDETWGKTLLAVDEDHSSALSRDQRWYNAIIEGCNELIAKLLPLHKELRAMESKLAKLWEIFQRDEQSPAQPPIYWSQTRFFLEGEEEAAREAIRAEAAMAKQKYREGEGDALVKAAAMVAEMLGL